MSAPERVGPIDVVENIGLDMEWLDEYMAREDVYESQPSREALDLLLMLDQEHPLQGEEVRVYGASLTVSMDEKGTVKTLSMPPEKTFDQLHSVKGRYHGYCVRQVYIPEANDRVNAVVHIVETGSYTYTDVYYDEHTVTQLSYVLAHGSQVVPTLPINAHSFHELRNRKSIEVFDEILFDEELSVYEKIKRIGFYANSLFALQPDEEELNYQRVSYLNAARLLDDVLVASNDLFVADREEYMKSGSSATFGAEDSSAVLRAPVFDILPGYVRFPQGILTDQPPELYVASTYEEQWMCLPIKSIKSAESETVF